MMKVYRSIVAAVMIAAFTVTPAYADEVAELRAMIEEMRSDYEERIQMLENKIDRLEAGQQQAVAERVAEVREELKQELRQEPADSGWKAQYVGRYDGDFEKGGFEVESPTGMAKVTVGGYMDHEFENFENTDSNFDQHRWIINIGAQLGERLRFFSEYEIEHGGPNASGGGEAKVEQAYIDFLITEWINLRAGAMLVPFGRTNIYHDSDLRDLTARPLVARDIIPTTWTESGAGFFGEFAPVIGSYEDLVVKYEVQVINGLNDGFSDTGLRGARGSLGGDNNNNKAVAGRMVLSPAIGQELAFSGYYGAYNDDGDSISGKGVDFLSTWGPLELTGEYALFQVNAPDFASSGITDIADQFEGYHVQAAYHFWPEFLSETIFGRTFDDPVFTLVGRYDWARIDDDADAGTGDNEEERWTLGINYRPVESWVMKLEYQWNDTENEALERGNNDGWFWSVAMGF